jgi:hypothetical protein
VYLAKAIFYVMKNKFLLVVPILCLFLSSCFELEETYDLHADGSYALTYHVDMGAMLGMVSKMMPDSIKKSTTYGVRKDSTIYLSNFPDSLKTHMNQKELEVLKQTKIRTQMDINSSLFRISIDSRGKSPEELNYYLSNFGKILHKSKANMEMVMTPPASIDGQKQPIEKGMPKDNNIDMPFENKEYEYVVTAKSFERKIKPEVLLAAKEKNKSVYEMLKGMNMRLIRTITINLPRAATSVDNPKAVLSADKKQFKLVLDMMETINDPKMLNFKVNY